MILGSVTQPPDRAALPLLTPRERGAFWTEQEYGGRGFRVDLSTSCVYWGFGCKDVSIVKRPAEAATSAAPESVATYLWDGATESGRRVLPWCYWKVGSVNEDNETLAQCVQFYGTCTVWNHATNKLAKRVFLTEDRTTERSFTFAIADMSQGGKPLFIRQHEEAMLLGPDVTRIFRTAVPATGGVAGAVACHELAVARDRCEAGAEGKANAAGARALLWWELPDASRDGSQSAIQR